VPTRAIKQNCLQATTSAGIKDSVIRFRNNVHEIEGKDNFLILDKLAAFLQINEEVQLQVNGLCDKAEFNKAKDSKILAFIDSVPTFARVKPELVKKGYLGLDMMRAMQVLYYLHSKGIDMKRISGTGMSYSSPGDTDPAENRKVVFNIERLKPLQSVRSFGLNSR
jgi:outer membrane protein OmpA-like peptidoglycan-associated protein